MNSNTVYTPRAIRYKTKTDICIIIDVKLSSRSILFIAAFIRHTASIKIPVITLSTIIWVNLSDSSVVLCVITLKIHSVSFYFTKAIL